MRVIERIREWWKAQTEYPAYECARHPGHMIDPDCILGRCDECQAEIDELHAQDLARERAKRISEIAEGVHEALRKRAKERKRSAKPKDPPPGMSAHHAFAFANDNLKQLLFKADCVLERLIEWERQTAGVSGFDARCWSEAREFYAKLGGEMRRQYENRED